MSRHVELYSPAIGATGNVVVHGHYGRPVLVFPAEGGSAWDFENQGMVGAVGGLLDARPGEALLRRLVRLGVVVGPLAAARGARARARPLRVVDPRPGRAVRSTTTAAARRRSLTTGCSLGAYHAANFALRRADLFPLAICLSGNYDPATGRLGRARRGGLLQQPDRLRRPPGRRPPRLAARARQPPARVRPGHVGGHDRRAGEHQAPRGAARREGHPARARPLGPRRPARLAVMARADRASSAPVLLMDAMTDAPDRAPARHRGGLADGVRDAPRPRSARSRTLAARPTALTTERITMEPFDLRAKPRYDLVVDRLAYWYYLPREWLKKVALMDDVYLLNSPFTFQSMEKHAAYCAMLRLGLKIPQTVLVPHKNPPDNARFAYTAAKYNQPFDLDEIAEAVGYPLFMKPYDGGQWVGVSHIRNSAELHRAYDASGQRLMHLQAAVDGFDVFARSLSIGAETMVMKFRPGAPDARPLRGRARLPRRPTGDEVLTISRLINAFFRWEFNSCETLVRGDEAHPIDYANASPDVAITSLHYYFPWAMKALLGGARSAWSPAAGRGSTSTPAATSRSATART